MIRVLRSVDTSNPVGDPIFSRPTGNRGDLMAALTTRVRQLIERSRARLART